MAHPTSALVTGDCVMFRVQGRIYKLSQVELRALLGLPPGDLGVGITIDRERLLFEFAGDKRTVEMSARQLERRLAKQVADK